MKLKSNFLFISHELSATGAPIVLLNTIRALKQTFDINVYVYSIKGGQLQQMFQEVAQDLYIEENKAFCKEWPLFDLAYFNSIESSHIYLKIKSSGLLCINAPVLLHTHEMFGTVQKYGIENSKVLLNVASHVICASETVKSNMIYLGFDSTKIIVIRPLISKKINTNDFNIECNQDTKVIDVVACGEISFNKGIDYFLQLAKNYIEKFPFESTRFVWIGADSSKLKALIEWDIQNLNLSEYVEFIGYKPEVKEYFKKSRVFILTSRQDSYPLVCLEALSEGLPILFFKETGGIRDLLDENCSKVVNYLDIQDGVEKLAMVLQNNELSSRMRIAAFAKFNQYILEMNDDFIKIKKIIQIILEKK